MNFITNNKKTFKLALFYMLTLVLNLRSEFNFPGSQIGGLPGGVPSIGGFPGSNEDFGDFGQMPDMDALFGSMDPKALEDMMAAADKMLAENPELAKQMEAMAANMGFGSDLQMPEPNLKQPVRAPIKDSISDNQTQKTVAKKSPKQKSSESSDTENLTQYSGFRLTLMNPKESAQAKNKAFTQLLVAFNKAYEKLKGFGLMTDPEQDHLIIPVREELLKFVQGELCQVIAGVITISENFSDKAFSGSSTKIYKQLFAILDLVEATLKKIEGFAAFHNSSSHKASSERDEPTQDEVAFIDGSGPGSINSLIDQINDNLGEIKKLLSDKKLKTQYEKHLVEKGFKAYQKRKSPYWPKYSSNRGQQSTGERKSSSPGSSYPRGGGYYRGGYGDGYQDPYGDYYSNEKFPPANSNSSEDPITSPVASKDSKDFKELKKEITELFSEIAALADMRIFDTESQKLTLELPFAAFGKIIRTLIEQKTYAQELKLFLTDIHNLKSMSKDEEKKDGQKEDSTVKSKKIDPEVAKQFKQQFPAFVIGLQSLIFVANQRLPYSHQPLVFFPGLLPTESQFAQKLSEAIKTSLGGDLAPKSPFAIPSPDQEKSEAVMTILQSFFTESEKASGNAKTISKILGELQETVDAVKKAVKPTEATKPDLQYSLRREFSTLQSRLEKVAQNLFGKIVLNTNTVKIFNATTNKDPFFAGLSATTEDQWPLFAANKEVQTTLVAISQLVVKYKVEFPLESFKELDREILSGLELVKETYEKFTEQFKALKGLDLKTTSALTPSNPFIEHTPGILNVDRRDAAREFLIALWGAGAEGSSPTDKTIGFTTFGFSAKAIAVLHDNIRQTVTGKPLANKDQLHTKVVANAEESLRRTYTIKTTVTDLIKNVKQVIGGVSESAANLIAGWF